MIIIIALSFIILLTIPLIGGLIYYKNRDGIILPINQDKSRDPRYFGKSFAGLIEKNLPSIKDGIIVLSRPESFIDADVEVEYEKLVDKIVIARKVDYKVSNVAVFEKEIYGGNNVILSGHDQLILRAAYSKENMIIGSNTQVIRWLDSNGTLAIYDNCDLGISVSSRIRMSLGKNCKFNRLYAPEIRLGQYPEDKFDAREGKNPKIYNMPIHMNKEKNIRYISSEMINHEGVVDCSIISIKNINITENIIIQGDVRSSKGVRLSEGAVVCGNVFAENDVYLGKNACVLGNIFSQENIYLEEGAVVGQSGRTCSVIARGKITFEKRNFVFGYISCEKGGIVALEENEDKFYKNREVQFLKAASVKTKLEFEDLYEYEHVDQQGFRFNKDLEEVIIPEKATIIPKSMFYNCESLETVRLPKMLRDIQAYSFANCKNLKTISLAQSPDLEKIGTSAFENCESLETLEIPDSVKSIEGAAFSGCRSLKRIILGRNVDLVALEDHCFRGCESLEEIIIPENIKKIGVSVFKDCSRINKIILPERCKNEPGILEIPQEKLELYEVEFEEVLVNANE